MQVYGLKNCDSTRAALKALQAAGHGAELVDVRETPLSDADLARFFAAFGDKLLNTRSTTWRGLDEAARAGAPEALIRAHPALMKRPVIDTGAELYLGWGAAVKAALS